MPSDGTESPDDDLLRIFYYPFNSPFPNQSDHHEAVRVSLRDGRSGGDIGCQTWNSAPLLSRRLCSQPLHFFHALFAGLNSSDASAVTPLPPLATPPPTRPTSPENTSADSVKPFRVLELGSGTGLTGITAGIVLARLIKEFQHPLPPVHLVLTDYLPPVLDNLRHNVSLNKDQLNVPGLTVEVELLDWRDLHSSKVKGAFDVVLGTDLVYEVQHADWAASVVEHFLAPQPAGQLAPSKSLASPPTPDDSRCPSPLPISPGPPTFHLVLALRPTFRAESLAVHRVFNSPFDIPHSNDSNLPLPARKYMPSSEKGFDKVQHHHHQRQGGLVTHFCATWPGIAHGQGCGDYQYLAITHEQSCPVPSLGSEATA